MSSKSKGRNYGARKATQKAYGGPGGTKPPKKKPYGQQGKDQPRNSDGTFK